MSYCRWSSERWQCDLYCYQSDCGWVTHVAGRRRTPFPAELVEPIDWLTSQPGLAGADSEKWWTPERRAAYAAVSRAWDEAFAAADWVAVESPHAGAAFEDGTLEAFRDRIADLAADPGLMVPSWLLPSIDAEIADRDLAVLG